jgi:hypothetical protein
MVKGSSSTYNQSCQNGWHVRCSDGALEYSFEGENGNFRALNEPPSCVCAASSRIASASCCAPAVSFVRTALNRMQQ